ncbi:MAG: hypothetical protein AUH28_16340 [Acidobacteria bacterium 13_1_40CM_56_16]|nr:MAG: hypothetical protein AUH28_16340 [Acidobacteria bacterium 13_1_40CM_56_16]
MGRKAYDAATLWLHGSKHGSQAAAPGESTVRAGRPRYPAGLTAAARRVFKELCAMLEERRALTRADGELLSLYASLSDRRARELALAESEGLIVSEVRYGHNGEATTRRLKNPHLTVAQESEKTMLAILDRLGLTPTGRDKVKPTAKAAPQPQAPGELIDVDALLEERGYSNALQTN